MTETLTIRIDSATKKRLQLLARQSQRPASFLAADAIASYVEAEEWRLREIGAGIDELDSGHAVSHDEVSKWLGSWGKRTKVKAPR